MKINKNAGIRRPKICTLLTVALLFVGTFNQDAAAQIYPQSRPFEVKNDRGGLLSTRIGQIRQLAQSGRPVRITGRICYSTCTMFLGLAKTCVSPRTIFGFHGPSSYGQTLDPASFNKASKIISDHYPAPLKRWYLDQGRYYIRTVYKMRGASIIKMGVKAC